MKNLFEHLRFFALKTMRAQLIVTLDTWLIDEKGRDYNHQFKVADSLVGNFMQLLYCGLSETNAVDYQASNYNGVTANNHTVKTITNTNGDIDVAVVKHAIPFNCHPPSNSNVYGLVWGTNATAPTALDVALGTIIANGNGAGQLSYQQGISSQIPTTVSNTTTFINSRLAINNSGAPITVNEVGIYLRDAADTFSFMVFHDAVAGLVVPSLNTIASSVTWTAVT